jgi:phosphoribosylanthranilate isomerase
MTHNLKQEKMLKIKVCGMRDAKNIEALSQLSVDYMGFIFYSPSPRFVGDSFDVNILKSIPKTIKKVGVFVNETLKEVERTAEKYKLDCIQLHGNEIPDYCNALKEKKYTVIKAFKGDEASLTCETAAYRFACDFYLFDTPTPMYGGSGRKFDWSILKQQKLYNQFFLSGGISLEDVEQIKNIDIPGIYAIDLNSKFEISPGLKDIVKIKQFVKAIRNE